MNDTLEYKFNRLLFRMEIILIIMIEIIVGKSESHINQKSERKVY